ncbi:MAG: GNAT family N-acetyltransferase [Hyphomonadaceae bacterium]|nr:GNAT family N-acetyltransferase [Hyphomonadaceae bacterium]MBC6411457.1 GNAT family N-acetyltransferase [Hyphomonadaceae bacterium]
MILRRSRETELFGQATGGGVRLRHPGRADYNAWAELRRSNADYLSPWEPDCDEASLTRNSYRALLNACRRMIEKGRGYPFHIFRADDNTLVGAVNVTQVLRQPTRSAHLGYWLGQRYAGRGYARAAVRSVLEYCFNDLGLHRINAAVQADNELSVRLLQALGFTREGTARGYLKINGHWRDHDVYALLSSD